MVLKKINLKHGEFLKDNFWLFAGFFLNGVFNYAYHFIMGRFLGPADYGVLGVMLSIMYLLMILVEGTQLTIVKMVSEFKSQKNFLKIKGLLFAALRHVLVYSSGLCLIFIMLSPWVSSFLKLTSLVPIIIVSISIIISFLLAVVRGVTQGMQMFKPLAINYALEGLVKLCLGVGLVFIGYGVNGSLGGVFVSFIVAFFFAFSSLKLPKRLEEVGFSRFYFSSFKTFIVLASLTLFYSVDLILVKHFFPSVETGYYAALSTMGKIILFGSYSVSYVMLPKISEYKNDNKKSLGLLKKSLLLVLLICAPVLLFYFVIPGLSISIIFGSAFLSIKNQLGLFGIFMTLCSLVYTISIYNLFLNKKAFVYILVVFNILEIMLICLFHNHIAQIVYILVTLMSILFIVLLTYTGVFGYRNLTYNTRI